MVRVFVVVDHDVLREGVAALLAAEPDLDVVADVGFASDLLARLEASSPDVIVIDHAPPKADGIVLSRVLRQAGVSAGVVLLADELNGGSADPGLLTEVREWVPRDVRSERLSNAVRAAASQAPAPRVPAAPAHEGVPKLGRSQLTVLRLVVEGKSVAEIAEATGLTHHTVRSYMREIYRRLGVSSRAEATAVALRLGLR